MVVPACKGLDGGPCLRGEEEGRRSGDHGKQDGRRSQAFMKPSLKPQTPCQGLSEGCVTSAVGQAT